MDMFAEELQRAVETAPRVRLVELSAALWKGHAAGAIGDDDAQRLAELIEARKIIPSSVRQIKNLKRHQGSRPRSSESMERRRRWVASGWLPPQLACRFTMAECAVLATIATEVARHAQCAMPLDKIAAIAGVSRSTAKTALRQAKALGLLSIEHRPDRPFKHLSNVIRITSPEWQAWLSMRRSSQGVKASPPTQIHHDSNGRGKDGAQSLVARVMQLERPLPSLRRALRGKPGQTLHG